MDKFDDVNLTAVASASVGVLAFVLASYGFYFTEPYVLGLAGVMMLAGVLAAVLSLRA